MATSYRGHAHLSIKGGIACRRTALVAVPVSKFRKEAIQCARCAAKLRKLDVLALRRIANDPNGWVAA